MTSKELLELNPGYNIDKIQIGEVLTLSEAVPYLTVTVKQRGVLRGGRHVRRGVHRLRVPLQGRL